MSDFNEYNRLKLDNERALHVALTPFRWLRYLALGCALGLLFVLSIGIAIFNRVGWVAGLGSQSTSTRQEIAAQIDDMIRSYDHTYHENAAIIDVNFAYRQAWGNRPPAPTEDKVMNTFVEDQILTVSQISYGLNDGISCELSPTSFEVPDQSGYSTFPNFVTGNKYGALDEKSLRMRRDYAKAAWMIAGLRTTINRLKYNTPKHALRCAITPRLYDVGYPGSTSPYMLNPDQTVVLPDAPMVRFREVHIEPSTFGFKWSEDDVVITGMCLVAQCVDSDLSFYISSFDNLHAGLSSGQMAAEEALLATADEDFWEKEARANGIVDMTPIRERREAVEESFRWGSTSGLEE